MPYRGQLVMMHEPIIPDPNQAEQELARLRRRVERERAAREQAEEIAERGLRDLYSSQRRLALLQRVTQESNRLNSITAALEVAISEICTELDWAFGNAFLVEEKTGAVVACDVWYAVDPAKIFSFIDSSRKGRFESNVGMPGRTAHSAEPFWIDDVRAESNCPRRRQARKLGFHSACAFPIKVGERVVAVIEFFAHKAIEQSEELVLLINQIGLQLGYVFEREQTEHRLLHEANHDHLTGLPNRTGLHNHGQATIRRGRNNGLTTGALMFDISGFKTINDRYGSRAGDDLLAEFANRIVAAVEDVWGQNPDTKAGSTAMIARSGGNEFVVLVEGEGISERVFELARAIKQDLIKSYQVRDQKIHVGVATGVAISDQNIDDFESLLKNAALAVEEAKLKGRNRTVRFDLVAGAEARHRAIIEEELISAIRNNEFVLEYQPIVDIEKSGDVVGFEALLRWQHPARGLLFPKDFLDVAERSGLLVFIGTWVLREGCAAAGRLRILAKGGQQPFISINVSSDQFVQKNFVEQVNRSLIEGGAQAEDIRLEITEATAIRNPENTKRLLVELKKLGVSTSLDDFGTGYSSLSYLREFPVDTIKIDRSFIEDLGDPRSKGIVGAILALAQVLDFRVIAEGIENESQRQALRELGCRLGQGFLYGKSSPECDAFAKANKAPSVH